jgi:hypothetical protein
MSRSHRFGHYSSMDETLAMLPSPSAGAGAMAYVTNTFTLATLKAAGATMLWTFNGSKLLPTNARVMAMEFSVDILFTADGLSDANGQVYVASSNDNQRKPNITTSMPSLMTPAAAGNLYCQDLSYLNGTNTFATQGGDATALSVALSGANFNNLTAGQVTVRTYYAVIA